MQLSAINAQPIFGAIYQSPKIKHTPKQNKLINDIRIELKEHTKTEKIFLRLLAFPIAVFIFATGYKYDSMRFQPKQNLLIEKVDGVAYKTGIILPDTIAINKKITKLIKK